MLYFLVTLVLQMFVLVLDLGAATKVTQPPLRPPPYNFKLSSNQSREGRVCGGWWCYDRARLEVS